MGGKVDGICIVLENKISFNWQLYIFEVSIP